MCGDVRPEWQCCMLDSLVGCGGKDPQERINTMPECYTHSYVATRAMMRAGSVITSYPAFLAGANGPDPLFAYQAWKRKPEPNLAALAKRMHREKAGAFLTTLVQLAMTPVQQSFALGFLCHYATDCVLNPYISAMSAKGAPYGGKRGYQWIQSAIDSQLYYNDYRTRIVPLHAGTPVVITDDLAQVTSLLHDALLEAYGVEIPLVPLADTYHNNLTVRKFLISPHGFKRALAHVIEPVLFGQKGRYKILSRMQPAKPLKKLPSTWTNPYTHEETNVTLEELVVLAEQNAAGFIVAAMEFWLGTLEMEQLTTIIGDNNYYTGLPPGAVDPENEPKQE